MRRVLDIYVRWGLENVCVVAPLHKSKSAGKNGESVADVSGDGRTARLN